MIRGILYRKMRAFHEAEALSKQRLLCFDKFSVRDNFSNVRPADLTLGQTGANMVLVDSCHLVLLTCVESVLPKGQEDWDAVGKQRKRSVPWQA